MAAGAVPSAIFAWMHFMGIIGVAGGLISERFLIKPGLTIEDEMKINNADGIYGLSALSLLITGSDVCLVGHVSFLRRLGLWIPLSAA